MGGEVKNRKSQAKMCSRDKENQATAFKTVEPVDVLIESMPNEWSQLAATIAYWGCGRINAVLHLQGKDLRGGVIRYRKGYSKTNTAHTVQISKTLAKKLEGFELPEGDDWLFPARGNRPNRESKVWRQYMEGEGKDKVKKTVVTGTQVRPVVSAAAFDQALKRAADSLIRQGHEEYYGVSSHTFRRSMCSYLYFTLGWSLRQIQQVSGHKSIDALQHYLAIDKTDVDCLLAEL